MIFVATEAWAAAAAAAARAEAFKVFKSPREPSKFRNVDLQVQCSDDSSSQRQSTNGPIHCTGVNAWLRHTTNGNRMSPLHLESTMVSAGDKMPK